MAVEDLPDRRAGNPADPGEPAGAEVGLAPSLEDRRFLLGASCSALNRRGWRRGQLERSCNQLPELRSASVAESQRCRQR